MIENPHAAKQGTTMPNPWAAVDNAERKTRASAIASYLSFAGKLKLQDRIVSNDLANQGKRLFEEVGCLACDANRNQQASATSVPLGDLAKKYTVTSLAKFLQNPHQIRPGVRMPSLTGSPDQAIAIAAHLTRNVTMRERNVPIKRTIYKGKWNRLPDFDSLEPVKNDVVTSLKFNDIEPKNNYGIVYEAEVYLPQDGDYTFKLMSDDGSSLSIGENRLLNDGVHPAETKEATWKLQAGVHPIRIEFFNAGGARNWVSKSYLPKQDAASFPIFFTTRPIRSMKICCRANSNPTRPRWNKASNGLCRQDARTVTQ